MNSAVQIKLSARHFKHSSKTFSISHHLTSFWGHLWLDLIFPVIHLKMSHWWLIHRIYWMYL